MFKTYCENLIKDFNSKDFEFKDSVVLEFKSLNSLEFLSGQFFHIYFNYDIKSEKLNHNFKISFGRSFAYQELDSGKNMLYHFGHMFKIKNNNKKFPVTTKFLIKEFLYIKKMIENVIRVAENLADNSYEYEIIQHAHSFRIVFKDLKLELSKYGKPNVYCFNGKDKIFRLETTSEKILKSIRKYKINLFHKQMKIISELAQELNEIKIKQPNIM